MLSTLFESRLSERRLSIIQFIKEISLALYYMKIIKKKEKEKDQNFSSTVNYRPFF